MFTGSSNVATAKKPQETSAKLKVFPGLDGIPSDAEGLFGGTRLTRQPGYRRYIRNIAVAVADEFGGIGAPPLCRHHGSLTTESSDIQRTSVTAINHCSRQFPKKAGAARNCSTRELPGYAVKPPTSSLAAIGLPDELIEDLINLTSPHSSQDGQ